MTSTATDVLLAGAFAAFTVDLVVYPIDTLKTRFQSPDYKTIYYNASKNAINRNLLFSGLYQGVGPIILVTIPSSGAFFTTYEAIKTALTRANADLTGSVLPQPLIHSTASATAELVSCFILTPAEVLKQNAQMICRPKRGPSGKSIGLHRSVTMEVIQKFRQHPTHLWRGYTALAGRNLPFTAMQFPLFEHLRLTISDYRKRYGKYTGTLLETGLITGLSAGSAGSIAAIVTTPVDVIKTRIMLAAGGERMEQNPVHVPRQNQKSDLDEHKSRATARKSSLTVAREVVKEAGFKGLFRGGILRAVWTALGSGLYLGVYECGKSWLARNEHAAKD